MKVNNFFFDIEMYFSLQIFTHTNIQKRKKSEQISTVKRCSDTCHVAIECLVQFWFLDLCCTSQPPLRSCISCFVYNVSCLVKIEHQGTYYNHTNITIKITLYRTNCTQLYVCSLSTFCATGFQFVTTAVP